MARAMIGIGSALRRARENRGKSVEEASRDTKIRAELLRSLERERFSAMNGDVYVRGFLRSYSQYLGLDPDKVVELYAEHAPPPPEGAAGPLRSEEPSEPELRPRRASSWILAVGIAITLFILAAATGLLSGSKATPDPSVLPSEAPVISPGPSGRVLVEMFASHGVHARIMIDGSLEYDGELQAKEARTYRAGHVLQVVFSKGGTVRLIVNRTDLGSPGSSSAPFSATYTPDSGGGPSPSPSPSA